VKKCSYCNHEFPEHLIQSIALIDEAGLRYVPICPICALATLNKMHGIEQTEFQGQIANSLLKEAREYEANR